MIANPTNRRVVVADDERSVRVICRINLELSAELGALDYVTKPFDPLELARKLERAIELVEQGGADAERRRRVEALL